MSEYQPHAPELWEKMHSANQQKWGNFLLSWKVTVQALCQGRMSEVTTLQKVRAATKDKDIIEGEYSALEDTLLREKHGIWAAKTIARELKRGPDSVYQRIHYLKRMGLLK